MQQRSVPALIGAAAALTAVIWALERRRRDEKGAKEGATLARVVYHTRRWWHRSTKTVALRDARALGSSLDKNGAATATFAPLAEKDVGVALDTESVARDLFPAAERLLEKHTGCARAVVFDHVVRIASGPDNAPVSGAAAAPSGPINFVHNDYSVNSGRPRCRMLLKPFATSEAALDEVVGGRVAVINVWVPLADVESDPLAFVDWKSLRPTDCRVRRVTYSERVGETTTVCAGDHDWLWFPNMKRGECMLLKTWDSKGPVDRSLYAAHASASVVGVDAARNPRRSIEMRCFVLYESAARDLFATPFIAPHVARTRTGESFYETVEKIEFVDEPADAWRVVA